MDFDICSWFSYMSDYRHNNLMKNKYIQCTVDYLVEKWVNFLDKDVDFSVFKEINWKCSLINQDCHWTRFNCLWFCIFWLCITFTACRLLFISLVNTYMYLLLLSITIVPMLLSCNFESGASLSYRLDTDNVILQVQY